MRKVMALALSLGTAACGQAPPPRANCAARPADFRSFAEPIWYGPGIPIEVPTPMRVDLDQDGTPRWNGAVLIERGDRSGWRGLDAALATGSGMQPPSVVTLVFARGASCRAVERARALIRRHGECGPVGRCLQGPPPP